MKKLLLALSLTAVCLGFQSGCGQKQPAADATPDKPAKHSIAVIPKGLAHFYWQAVRAGAKSACDEFGYQMSGMVPSVKRTANGRFKSWRTSWCRRWTGL